jgi:DNA polymerase I
MNPRPRMGERVTYYIGPKAKGHASDWQRARPLAQYETGKAPYAADYYLVKIDDWLERYGRFLGIKPKTAQDEMTLE